MPAEINWRPRLESPESIRQLLAFAALFCVAALIYASLIPFKYADLSWAQACDRWRSIPWLNLDVYYRSDWVANALVVLPAGFLAAAAVDWGRSSRWQLLVATPAITFGLALLVFGIELGQVWFPTRTVSLNDIAAGFVGAAVGPVMWAVSGPFVERGITQFLTLPRFRDRLEQLCLLWLIAIVVYSVLPLDLIVSRAEWQQRWNGGRVQLNPLASEVGGRAQLFDFLLSALRMGPIGLLIRLAADRRKSWRWAVWWLPIALELIQLPVFSKFVTLTAVFGGWAGGWIGYVAGTRLDQLLKLAAKPTVWACGWGLSYAATLVLLLGGFNHVITNREEAAARLQSAWALPLVNYYAGAEYTAYTSIAEKMILFGAIGGCCAGWIGTVARQVGRWIFWSSLAVVLVTAFAVEFLQAFLPPSVPDVSDVLIYMLGYACGYLAILILSGGDWCDSHAGGGSKVGLEHTISAVAPATAVQLHDGDREMVEPLGHLPRVVMRVLAVLVGLLGLVSAARWPLGMGWGLTGYLAAIMVLALRPKWWLVILPFVVVAGDFYLWTGSLLCTESDLFCLAALSVLLWREGSVLIAFVSSGWPLALWAPLAISVAVSSVRGWLGLPPSLAGDQLGVYLSQENALRVAKGFAWGLLFAPFVIDAVRWRDGFLDLVRSLQMAALFVGLGVILERSAAVGLLNFESVYRATGPIASMHVGGQHIDTFWVLVLPLLFLPSVGALTPTNLAARLGRLSIAFYSIAATMSRALIGIAAVQLAICVISSVLLAGRGIGAKFVAGAASVVIVVIALLLARTASDPIEDRFSHSIEDAGVRWDHWAHLCRSAGGDLWTVVFGRGLGTVPIVMSEILALPSRPAEVVVDETGVRALRLTPGRLYYVEQFVPRRIAPECRFAGEIRSHGEVGCTASICRKTLIQSFQCASVQLPMQRGSDDWHRFDFSVDLKPLAEVPVSPIGLPVTFSLATGGEGEGIELRNLSLQDGHGRDLLKNADFSAGSRYWFFTSDDHLQWHAKNVWVHLFVEQGLLGIASFAWLMAGTLWMALRRAWGSRDVTAWLPLVSIAGCLAIGMVESLLNTPWIAVLLLLVTAAVQGNALGSPADGGGRLSDAASSD